MESTNLQQAASDVAGKSRSFISAQLDQQSTRIGQTVSSTADDLRRIAAELRSSETVSGSADLAERGADFIARAGSYLQDSAGEQLITDLETLILERPWVAGTLALTAGFAAARVLKVSSSRRYRERYGK
jgi:hypothetical protein